MFQILLYKLEQAFYRLFLGNVLLYALLCLVEGYLATGGTNVAIVGICHFARAVDDTPHDGYLQAFEMSRGGLDLVDGAFEVVKRAAATGARDVLRLDEDEK